MSVTRLSSRPSRPGRFRRLTAVAVPTAAALVLSSVVGVLWPSAASAAPPAPAAAATPATGGYLPAPSPLAADRVGSTFPVARSAPVFGRTGPAPAVTTAAACRPGVPTAPSSTELDTYSPNLYAIMPSSCSNGVAAYFRVWDKASGTNVYTASGTTPANTGIGTSVTVGTMRIGIRYAWAVMGCYDDGTTKLCSAETPARDLMLNPWQGAGEREAFTFDQVPLSSTLTGKVNVGTGNLFLTANALSLVGATNATTMGMAYNSVAVAPESPVSGGIGGWGWRALNGPDYSVVQRDTTTATVYAPNGTAWGFTGNPPAGSPYTAPAGVDSTLVRNADGTWTLTQHATGRKITFSTTGHQTSERSRNNTGLTFTYVSDQEATSVSPDAGPAGVGYRATMAYVGGSPTLLKTLTQAGTGLPTRTVTYTYEPGAIRSFRLRTITDAANRVTTFGYDTGNRLTRITTPGGLVTDITYEAAYGRVASVTQDPAGVNAKTTYAYTDYATPQGTERALGEIKVTAPNDQGTTRATTYRVDYAGRVVKAVDPLGNTRSRTYSPDAKVASLGDAAGTTRFGYSSSVNNGESLTGITLPTSAASSISYSGGSCAGSSGGNAYQPKCGTDFSGNKSTYSYDGPGNLTSSQDASAAKASVAYNTNGTPQSSTDPVNQASANRTGYTYDANKQLQKITPPTGNSLAARTFTYDGFGRLRTVTTGRGVVQTYTYNGADEVTGVDYSDATPDVSQGYDADGHVIRRTDGTGTTGYSYDKLGRTTGKNTTSATVGCPTAPSVTRMCYGYDRNGNVTSSADGRGTTTYGYDAANQLTSLVEGRDGTRMTFKYDAAGRRTDVWAKAGSTAVPPTTFALHQRTGYDASGRIRSTVVTRNSSDAAADEVLDQTVCYSAYTAGATTCAAGDSGQRKWMRDNNTGAVTVYGYDGGGRLLSADRQDAGGEDYRYCYDAGGNITIRSTSSTALNCATATGKLTYNSANQQTGTGAPAYDADGNVTASPTSSPALTALGYDGADRMTSVTPAGGYAQTATYAGTDTVERRRLGDTSFGVGQLGIQSDTVAGTTHYFEQDPTGSGPLAISYDAVHAYLYTDVLGNVAGTVDAAGAAATTYRYDPYGAHFANTGTVYNPFLYKAGYRDQATKLVKFGNRYYDPTQGRWTQQDSLTFLNDPAQGNRYAYVGCNPVNLTDPTGNGIMADVVGYIAGAVFTTVCAATVIVATGGIGIAAEYLCGVGGAIFGGWVTSRAADNGY